MFQEREHAEGDAANPAKHPFYYAGLYYLQEPSAMTPASRAACKTERQGARSVRRAGEEKRPSWRQGCRERVCCWQMISALPGAQGAAEKSGTAGRGKYADHRRGAGTSGSGLSGVPLTRFCWMRPAPARECSGKSAPWSLRGAGKGPSLVCAGPEPSDPAGAADCSGRAVICCIPPAPFHLRRTSR